MSDISTINSSEHVTKSGRLGEDSHTKWTTRERKQECAVRPSLRIINAVRSPAIDDVSPHGRWDDWAELRRAALEDSTLPYDLD